MLSRHTQEIKFHLWNVHVCWPQMTAKSSCLPPSPMGWGESRRNARDLWIEIMAPTREEKHCGYKQSKKGGIHSLPISKQMSRHFLASRASACRTVAWEHKCHNHQCRSFIFLSMSFYCWAYDDIWHRISFWSSWFSCPSSAPFQPLASPCLLHSLLRGTNHKFFKRQDFFLTTYFQQIKTSQTW